MRMTGAILVLTALVVATTAPGHAQECSELDASVRGAILEYAANFFPLREKSTCAETVHEAVRTITSQGSDILPCLLEIYEHGFTKNDLWPLDTPPPKDGRWVLGLIGRVSPKTAKSLYRSERESAAEGSLARVQIDMELAKFGGRDELEALTLFLANPPEVSEEEWNRYKNLTSNAIELIGQQHYQPGLEALESVLARGWKYHPRLKVFVAQLSEDVAALREYANETEAGVGMAALRSLARIGQTDVLEELANDLHYRYHDAAAEILEKSRQ